MPYEEDAHITTYFTPWDRPLGPQVTALLAAARPGYGIAWCVYTATLKPFFDGISAAFQRGCVPIGVFDLSQEVHDAAEARAFAAFLQSVPLRGHYVVGNSPLDRQIVHIKGLAVNVPMDDAHPPILPTSSYSGVPVVPGESRWLTLAKSGAPIVWTGSYNFTVMADIEVNNVDIVASDLRAAFFLSMVRTLYADILASGPQPSIEEIMRTMGFTEKDVGISFYE